MIRIRFWFNVKFYQILGSFVSFKKDFDISSLRIQVCRSVVKINSTAFQRILQQDRARSQDAAIYIGRLNYWSNKRIIADFNPT